MRNLLLLILISLPALAQEESEALSAMRLGCNKHGVALGCYNYANMLTREERLEEAQKYFEQGCKLKHQASCDQQKWDIPERVKTATLETPTPAPASIDETIEPESSIDLSLDIDSDINQ